MKQCIDCGNRVKSKYSRCHQCRHREEAKLLRSPYRERGLNAKSLFNH